MNTWLLAAMLTAQSFDLSTTLVNLHKGCHELVSPIKHPMGLLATKLGSNVSLVITLPYVGRRFPKVAKGAAITLIGAGVLGGSLNVRTMPKCHRP